LVRLPRNVSFNMGEQLRILINLADTGFY
jgi:hypothetical protein